MTPKEHTRLRHEEEKRLRKESKTKKRVIPSATTFEELKYVLDLINKEKAND